ncbi:MAG: hypothetical protein ACREIF_13115, partial [Chthoniobacterales bacterium]
MLPFKIRIKYSPDPAEFAKAVSLWSNWRLKMDNQQEKEQYSGVRDQEIRAALDQHWAASDANDFETE